MRFFLFSIVCFCSVSLFGQQIKNLSELKPLEHYENIHAMKYASDSLVSSFVIWIKNEVLAHKHETHSEHVLVISGKGTLLMNGKEYTLRKGDFIFIPKGTTHSVKVKGKKPLQVLSIQAPYFDGTDRVIVPD